MTIASFVYLDGQIMPRGLARVSVFDRGLLFGHAAYEVTAVVGGRLVDASSHFERLARTLKALDIPEPMDADELEGLHLALVRENEMDEGLVYMQVTAGDYGERDFFGPPHLRPRLFIFCQPLELIGPPARDGVAAITLEDTRWQRRDLKTTQLVSQVLAYRTAREAGARTAILVEDGHVTEAASANLWVVTKGGKLATRELSNAILHGITRATVMGLAGDVEERAISIEELRSAREVFTSSAGAMILPVVSIDGTPVGSGAPGPVTRRIQSAYYAHCGFDLATRVPWLDP